MMALFFLLMAPLLVMWEGYVISVMWGWFLVPKFGFPMVGVAQGIGISMLIALVTHQRPRIEDDKEGTKAIGWGIGAPLVALFVGWIAKHFL